MLEKKRISELEEKIEKAKEIFKQAYEKFDPQDMRLIWSGGKDSTLTLWICKQFCEENNLVMPKAFTIDEGDPFEEIDEHEASSVARDAHRPDPLREGAEGALSVTR